MKSPEFSPVPLGDLVENLDRLRVPVTRKDRTPGPYPYYGAAGIQDWVSEYIFEGPHLLVAEDGSVESDDGGLVLQMVNGKFWVNNHAHVLRAPTPEDSRYIFYALRTVKARPYMTGAVQQKISQHNLNRIPVPFPDEITRRHITRILGSLDDKIELSRRMNQTLEEIAQAIFKSWFIDFDGVPPEDLVEHGLGSAPRAWRPGNVSEIAELLTDSVRPGDSPDSTWEHYSIPAFDERQDPARDLGATIKSGKYRVPHSAVLVSKLNPQIRRVWMPDVRDSQNAVCSTEFMPFRPRGNWRAFVYDFFRSAPLHEAICSKATGSTGSRQRVRPGEIAALPVLVPPDSLLDRYEATVGPLHHKRLENRSESATLVELRDTLLPKLVSGELRVPDAEEALEATA